MISGLTDSDIQTSCLRITLWFNGKIKITMNYTITNDYKYEAQSLKG